MTTTRPSTRTCGSGRIDAVLNDRLTAIDMMNRTGGVFVGAGPPFARQEMGAAVRKDQPALLADLNQALAALRSQRRTGPDIDQVVRLPT